MRVILMLVMLAACNTSRDEVTEVTMENGEKVADHSKYFKTTCINGVAYYTGYHELAPRFDPKTKQVVTCE